MAAIAELAGGAILGTVFAELYKIVKESRSEVNSFKCHLNNLNSTLDSLKPRLLQQIEELNVKLGDPTDDMENLKKKMAEGAELVGKLRHIRKRDLILKRMSYKNQLVELDRSLKKLLDTLKLQEAMNVKEIKLKLIQLEELIQMVAAEMIKVRQEPRDAKETLLSAVQTGKQVAELEASIKGLLHKPELQWAEINVQETRDFLRSTEITLKRVKENGVLKELASLVRRTTVGAILQELFDALNYNEKDKCSKLDLLKPLIQDMHEKYNRVLDRPQEELERFKVLVEHALDLVRSKICVKIKNNYGNQRNKQLLAISEKCLVKLLVLLDILKVQESSNVNETTTSDSIEDIEKVVLLLYA